MSTRDLSEAHLRQKRARSQLSCTACRQGKLRCNRATPCDQCIKRSRDSSCIYLPPARRSQTGQNVKGRIRHLEQLVVNLMNSKSANGNNPGSNSGSSKQSLLSRDSSEDWTQVNSSDRYELPTEFTPPHSEDDNNNNPQVDGEAPQSDSSGLNTFGHLRISRHGTSYQGSSHWATILDSISELKRDLEEDDDQDEEVEFDAWQVDEPLDTNQTGLPGLLHSPKRVTKAELLQSLPAKSEVDRLVSIWFNALNPFKSIIHAPQFQSEYRQFWREPTKAPTMWLGLLYAIISSGCSFRLYSLSDLSTSEAQKTLKEADLYHELSASAAVLAGYTKPKAYTIECLIMYIGGIRSVNSFEVWVLIGVVIRLALRMGYHRDASHYSNLSPFSGEMRRRAWTMLYMGDVMLSFQLGLPAMVRSVASDTEPPHNLLDQDFSIHSKILPPSRPNDVLTPSSYANAKARICNSFSMAADLSHATVAPSYTEVIELDSQLEAVRGDLPPALRFQSMDSSITETAESIMCRITLDLVYLKTKVIMHRRFMVSTPTQPAQPYSRECCIRSAMRTLSHHHAVYAASRPGGQLETVAWWIGSVGTHDFMLASVIICLELGQQYRGKSAAEVNEVATRDDMINALEKSKQIWEESRAEAAANVQPSMGLGSNSQSSVLADVQKACKAITVMLEKIKQAKPDTDKDGLSESRDDDLQWMNPSAPTATAWLGMPTDLLSTHGNLPGWGTAEDDISMLGSMFDIPDEINWEAWDHQINGQPQQGEELNQYGWNVDETTFRGGSLSDLSGDTIKSMFDLV